MSLSERKGISIILICILIMGTLLGCSIITSNSTPLLDGVIDTSRYVKLSMCLIGPSSTEAIMNYEDIVGELNTSLKNEMNTNVEITFIPFDEVTREYPLIFNSKKTFDVSYTSTQGNPSFFSLVAQGAFKPLDELLPLYAKELWENISVKEWDDTRYDGKIYGVPFGWPEYRVNGFVYREDLLEKHKLEPILSIDGMESYLDTMLKEEKDLEPIGLNEEEAIKLYDMLVDLNATWIPAPGLPKSDLYLVCKSMDDISDILHPAFSKDFLDFAERMKAWSDKGYWREDVFTEDRDVVNKFYLREGASLLGGFSEYYNDVKGLLNSESSAESEFEFYCFGEVNQKIIKSTLAKNVLGVSAETNNPERALMLIDFIMGDKVAYELINYGFQGEILNCDEWNDIADHYDGIAIKDPYAKFIFDLEPIEKEIEDILRVNSQYGIPILLGKAGNPKKAVDRYREELMAAGIQKVINTLKDQLKDNNFPIDKSSLGGL